MRKDRAFKIYEISYEIRPKKCRCGGVKDKNLRNYIISSSTPVIRP